MALSLKLPELPKLPTLGGRRKKAAFKGPDRRKSKRITLAELNEFGAGALRERISEITKKPDRRPAWVRVLDVLDIPRNVIANVIGSAAGVKTAEKEKAGLGLPRVYVSDILKKMGVSKGPARSILGFVGDVAIDPLTYASFGALTGTKIAQHLPKILKPAKRMLQTAARTGKASPALAKAIGLKSGQLSKIYKALVAKRGAKAAEKILFARRGGFLARRLESQATKGAKGALEFFQQFGEKGRALFRVPGMAKGFPVVKAGAKARKFRAVQEALELPGKFEPLRVIEKGLGKTRAVTAKALAAERGLAGTLQAAARAGPPGALSQVTKKLAKQQAKLGEKAAKFGKLTKGLKAERMRFATSPEAPKILQEAKWADIGRPWVQEAPGFVRSAMQAKRQLFGPTRSPTWQKMVGITARYGPRAKGFEAVAKGAVATRVEPIVARLVKDPKILKAFPGGADDIRKALHTLRETGEFAPDDIIRQLGKAASGVGSDPQVKKLLGDIRRQLKGLGGKSYQPRVLVKEAREALRVQAAREPLRPVARPRRLATPRPEDIARTKALEYSLPGAETQRLLSTNLPEIARLEKAGYKLAATHDISVPQWNKWAQEGKLRNLLGPEHPGIGQYRGPLFQEDVAVSAGAHAAQRERSAATREFTRLTEQFAAEVPEGAAGMQKWAHYSSVKKPVAGGPFDEMMRAGVFDKQYPVQIADMLNRMTSVWNDPQAINKILGATDKGLGIWKSFQLYHPSYVIRNVWQNFFGGMMVGANPLKVAKFGWGKEGRILRQALISGDTRLLAGRTMELHGRAWKLTQLYDEALKFHITGAGQTAQELPRTFAGATTGQMVGARAKNIGQRAHGFVFKRNAWFEDTQKLGTWMNFLDDGMTSSAAAMKVQTAMPDLGDLTRWESRYMKQIIPFYCVPPSHRILTRKGWKEYTELEVGEDVLTYNIEKDVSEWQPLRAINTFDYNGVMMKLEGKLGKYIFTPNHRWAVFHHTSKNGQEISNKRKVVPGYRLNASHRIPRSAPHTFPKDSDIAPRDAALIGWIFTDGHLRKRKGKYWDAVIYQKKPQHVKEIRKLLGSDARAEYVHPDTETIHMPLSAELTKRLVEICPSKEKLPELVTRLTEPAAKAMWQAMMDAEGSCHERAGTTFAQNGGPVMVAFQVLTILLNRTCHTRGRADSGKHKPYISAARRMLKVTGILGHEWYEGKVWCPTTDNGTWFMEHEGRAIICGNSWFRRNGALQLFHHLPRRPAYAASMGKLKNFMEGIKGQDSVPEELRAEWMREQMAWQMTGDKEKGATFLPTTWLPFEEIYQAGSLGVAPGEAVRRTIGAMNPAIKLAMGLGTGYDAFRKTPYEKGTLYSPADLAKAVPKAIMGQSRTPLDQVLSLRPAREWGPGGRVAEMEGVGAKATRMVLGGALQPVSQQRGLAAEYHRLRGEATKLRQQINRALSANDMSLADDLKTQLFQVWATMQRLGLPGVPKATASLMQAQGIEAGPAAFER